MTNRREPPSLTYAEINLKALAHNYRELRRITAPSAKMTAVVKADGYGHGAVRVATVALENGADFLAVARINEVAPLRQAGIEAPILLFGHCRPEDVCYLVENDVRASVNTLESARALAREAGRLGVLLNVHLKIDTGMGRLGMIPDRLIKRQEDNHGTDHVVENVLEIATLPDLEIEGIYTHFANADTRDKAHAVGQFDLFQKVLDDLEKQSFQVPYRHAANSAAIIELPETHLDMVRPGIAQYGLLPSLEIDQRRIALQPVMSLKSRIIQLKEVPAGFKVSYGSTYETDIPTQIATIPIGYADGFDRILSSQGSVLVRGKRAPIIGRVCMDLTILDVGCISGVQTDDEVVILGRQGEEEVTADEIASHVPTINYEVVSSLTSRVERRYIY